MLANDKQKNPRHLQKALIEARSTLAMLEEQAAIYAVPDIPPQLKNELDAKRSEVVDLGNQIQLLSLDTLSVDIADFQDSDIVVRDLTIDGDNVLGDKIDGNKVEIDTITVEKGGNINIAGGDIIQRVTNFFSGISDAVFERFRKQQLVSFAILGVLIVSTALILYWGLKPRQPEKMPGGFGIVVASFSKVGEEGDPQLGTEIAKEIESILNANLEDISVGELDLKYPITIWGPDQVRGIQGITPEKRALEAEKLAKDIGAEIIIYGVVTTTLPISQVAPEFFVSTDSFYEAQEITGQSQFGREIEIQGPIDLPGLEMITPMYIRSQALSRLTIGLAYYAIREYTEALKIFKSAETISGWEDDQGKEVLYLLMGNTLAREYQIPLQMSSEAIPDIEKLNQADAYYQKSKAIKAEYSRALVGLGNIAYFRALIPFQESMNYEDIDIQSLDACIQLNKQALEAEIQPPLAEIEIKVHYNLGVCFMSQVLAGDNQWFDPAMTEFQTVIDDYNSRSDETSRKRVKEMASEAHARLALIYDLSNYPEESLREYREALNLSEIGHRRDQYQKRINVLSARLTDLPPKP